jgi:hypothetical protein
LYSSYACNKIIAEFFANLSITSTFLKSAFRSKVTDDGRSRGYYLQNSSRTKASCIACKLMQRPINENLFCKFSVIPNATLKQGQLIRSSSYKMRPSPALEHCWQRSLWRLNSKPPVSLPGDSESTSSRQSLAFFHSVSLRLPPYCHGHVEVAYSAAGGLLPSSSQQLVPGRVGRMALTGRRRGHHWLKTLLRDCGSWANHVLSESSNEWTRTGRGPRHAD